MLIIKRRISYDKTMSSSLFSESGKGERHVFCKNKKYSTLCSVALGTMVTAIVAWGSAVAQADEVTTPLISETNYNGNPNYTFRKLSGVDSTISFVYTTK